MAISTPKPKTRPDAGRPGAAAPNPRAAFSFPFPRRRAVKPSEQIFFFSQISLMAEIGTPLAEGLRALAGMSRNPAFKEILLAMHRDLEEGKQLSDAMMPYPQVFNRIHVSLARAGEAGGFLKKSLDDIVVLIERRQALTAQLRATLTYPLTLCVVGAAVVVFVIVGILPKFMVLFEGKEKLLPPATRILMALSASMRGYWWIYLAAAAGLGFLGGAFMRSSPGQALRDRFLVSAPVVAATYNKIFTCQFLRTLGNLMQSHVPLMEALEITQATFMNRNFVAFSARLREHVQGGGSLSAVFARTPYVSETVKQMVATGEEAGKLPQVMLRLSQYYDAEIQQDLRMISSLMEPAALIVIGSVVGLLVSAVILPIFRIAGTVQ